MLPFLLASRYCDTDKLSDTAWQLFGHTPEGWARVQAIVDYVHNHIRFDYQRADATRSASTGSTSARASAGTSPTSPSPSAAA